MYTALPQNRQRVVAGMLPLALLALGEQRGVPAAELATEAGLAPSYAPNVDDRLPLEVGLALWRGLLRRFPDAPLGLELADGWRTASLGLIGYLTANAATLGEALDRFVGFQAMVDGEARMSAAVRDHTLVVSFEHDPPLVALRQPMEALLASGHAYCQRLLGAPLTARKVRFGHPNTLGPEPYCAFFGVQPEHGTDRYELHYDATVLALPIPGADPHLDVYLVQLAEAERARRPVAPESHRAALKPLVAELRRRLDHGLALQLSDCSRALGQSPRALQRELAEYGTTFRALVDGERRRRAELLLASPHTSVMDAATATGFSELASFSRAFRRWTGVSPAGFRRSLTGPDGPEAPFAAAAWPTS